MLNTIKEDRTKWRKKRGENFNSELEFIEKDQMSILELTNIKIQELIR